MLCAYTAANLQIDVFSVACQLPTIKEFCRMSLSSITVNSSSAAKASVAARQSDASSKCIFCFNSHNSQLHHAQETQKTTLHSISNSVCRVSKSTHVTQICTAATKINLIKCKISRKFMDTLEDVRCCQYMSMWPRLLQRAMHGMCRIRTGNKQIFWIVVFLIRYTIVCFRLIWAAPLCGRFLGRRQDAMQLYFFKGLIVAVGVPMPVLARHMQ